MVEHLQSSTKSKNRLEQWVQLIPGNRGEIQQPQHDKESHRDRVHHIRLRQKIRKGWYSDLNQFDDVITSTHSTYSHLKPPSTGSLP